MTWPDSAVTMAGSEKVMTIATCSDKGSWSAPVYYVFRERAFYFFSNPKSRHIMDTIIQAEQSEIQAEQSENNIPGYNIPKNDVPHNSIIAGVSIFSDSLRFDNIKGLQMTGRIEQVTKRKQALAAAGDYITKFRMDIKKKNIKKRDALQFIVHHFHASFYKFIPESVYYMNNSINFGCREKLMP